ncbi:MAG TPA: hypothetical protein VG318_15130 [Actinomycetota bacterium]|nr:hypothetical protein [Actinomycetota bacterium]
MAAVVLAVTLVPVGAAVAHGSCTPSVTSNPRAESGNVYGAGKIVCDSTHTITITVSLQRRAADGSWDTRASNTNQQGTVTQLQASVSTSGCQSGTWRTKVDGSTNHFSLIAVTNPGVTVSC